MLTDLAKTIGSADLPYLTHQYQLQCSSPAVLFRANLPINDNRSATSYVGSNIASPVVSSSKVAIPALVTYKQ